MYTAHQVRAKARRAVKRRLEEVEQEEIEGGEINLVPYLDIVTNLMLFLLASVTAVILLGQINTTLPDKGPPAAASTDVKPDQTPDEQPLKLVVSVTKDRALLWSFSGLEGTLQAPKLVLERTGRVGDSCDGSYMCETGVCDGPTQKCVAGAEAATPVFDYRRLNAELHDIAKRRYAGKKRGPLTYQAILMADDTTPYSTLISFMGALRCKMPEFGKVPVACFLPTDDENLKKAANPVDDVGFLYDTARADYDPDRMALFHDILFSGGFN
jgi:biopolymer transport protein TolR